MPRRIEDAVAKNREGQRRLEGYTIDVETRGTRSEVLGGNTVYVNVALRVYTRPLQDSLIVGHPDPEHGIGRGGMADNRGDWTLVTDTEVSKEFTAEGRRAVVDSLEGGKRGLQQVAVGTGTSGATTGDSSLDSETGSVFAFGVKDDDNTTAGRGLFRFHEFGDAVTEYGLKAKDGKLMARATTSEVDPSSSEELRAEVALTFIGGAEGDAVITDQGEKGMADAIQIANETAGLFEVAIGTGALDPDETQTSLSNELDRKRAARRPGQETIQAYAVWGEDEPSSQPETIREFGLFDYDGNMVYRMAAVDWLEKTEAFPLKIGLQLRVI